MSFWIEKKWVVEKPFDICLSVSIILCLFSRAQILYREGSQPGFCQVLQAGISTFPGNTQLLEVVNSPYLSPVPRAVLCSISTWREGEEHGLWVKCRFPFILPESENLYVTHHLRPKEQGRKACLPYEGNRKTRSHRVLEKYRRVLINFQETG